MGLAELEAKKAAEAVAEAAPSNNQFSTVSPKAELELMIDRAAQLERTTGNSGVIPNAPKAALLNVDSVQLRHPTKRIKWVNVKNTEKAQLRESTGYTRLPITEGGRQVGDLALFSLPRDVYEARVKDVEEKNKARLQAHKTEVEAAAEGIMRELRDRHGIKANILISE